MLRTAALLLRDRFSVADKEVLEPDIRLEESGKLDNMLINKIGH
jgi:hypothetical protein